MDEAAFPGNATCYRSLAQEALGPRIDERYQLRPSTTSMPPGRRSPTPPS